MNDQELAQQLKRLRRRVEQLQAEFQHQRVDEGLFAEMETLLERGLSADDRCRELQRMVDRLREDQLITASGNHHEAVRACVRIKIVIDRLIADLDK